MVKGINRQVIVVRPPDQKLFEQAIFLLRPDAQDSCNVTQDELLRQAQQAAKGYSTAHLPVKLVYFLQIRTSNACFSS